MLSIGQTLFAVFTQKLRPLWDGSHEFHNLSCSIPPIDSTHQVKMNQIVLEKKLKIFKS